MVKHPGRGISLVDRVKGWEQALFRFTCEAMTRPHTWGETDCVMFAADCVKAMTGEDPAANYRGKYDSREGAARVIARAGFDNLGDMIAAHLEEIEPSRVSRGDIIFSAGPDGDFLAVVQGATSVGPTSAGLIHIQTRQAKRAFKV